MTAPVFGLAVGLFRTPRPGTSTQAICRHGVVLLPCSERAKATAFPQHLNSLPCPVGQLVNAAPTFHSSSVMLINDFRPSHPTKTFGLARSAEPPPAVVPVLSSTLLPGLSAMDGVNAVFLQEQKNCQRPELHHYYGFICHLAPITALAFALVRNLRHHAGCGVRLPRLLHRLPVNDATLKHSTGLTEYRASRYFARLPTCTAEAGSLALCTV